MLTLQEKEEESGREGKVKEEEGREENDMIRKKVERASETSFILTFKQNGNVSLEGEFETVRVDATAHSFLYVFYRVVLFCIVLYCVVLFVLYCTVLCCFVLYFTVLCCLYFVVLCFVVCIVL